MIKFDDFKSKIDAIIFAETPEIQSMLLKRLYKELQQVKKLNKPAVSISLPSDIQLAILCTVADAYLYEGLYEDLHIGGKGIIRVIEEWEAMKKRQ